jgi:hypothetical protein
MYQSVGAVSGALELIHHVISAAGEVPENVNWCAVDDLLSDCRRRLGDVLGGLSHLEEFEE